MMLLGFIGMRDDYLKIKRGKGLSRKDKLFAQIAVGICLGLIICSSKNLSTEINFPFFKKFIFDLGYFYIFWVCLVIVASSNAVNFTDGLDGLAIGGIVTTSLVFAVLSYITGHIKFSEYLFVPYIRNAGEFTVLCSAVLGSSLAFLWFNSYPAEVFMGDTGALSLGGVIGVIALFIKKEFLLIIAGGIFALEALSVIVQIFSVRMYNRKIFKAAPLHHHFQLKGIPESKIIIRFWIVSIMLAVFSLLTLKLR
jgi:phospho-N-acetylmuramoyl-pentapeptide-transferase